MGIPVIMGILPLRTARHADFLHQKVAGIAVPGQLRKQMHQADNTIKTGNQNAREMLTAARERFAGACIMPPFDHYEVLEDILILILTRPDAWISLAILASILQRPASISETETANESERNVTMTTTRKPKPELSYFVVITTCLLLVIGCSKAYYGAMEKVGVHKRDILVDRVENARDAQADAQEQFKDALEQFGSVVNIENTDLKEAYEKLNSEYEKSDEAAKEVSSRIEKVESVADDLFAEWEKELDSIYKPGLAHQQCPEARRHQETLQ